MIEYEKRAMIEAEDKYTFRQSTQISMQTGLIGHLRADMDTDGNGFFSSWFDFREELKTDGFKAEFDDVINSLREEGDILHNRRALAKYCYCTPQSRMQEEPGYYGVRVDTEKYAYLLRLNPDRGEYNLYCYCYRRDWLDQHLKDAEKGIRFIDSHYKELFRIPDGGKVKIHYSWNEEQIRTCRYMRVNAMTEKFEDVTVLGHPMLFTCLRVDRDTVPQGMYMYEVRHDDDQQGEPVQIANWIMVNHWGTLISNRPIRLEPRPDGRNAYRDIDPENNWIYEGTLTTVKEYMEKNPPAVHKQKDHEPAR